MEKLRIKKWSVISLISLFLFTGILSSCSSKSTMPKKKVKKTTVIKENYKLKGSNKPRK